MPELGGLWVYGVAGAGAVAPEEPGVDPEHAVTLISHVGLAAIVSRIGFGARALDEALDDLDRLEALARGHARVLDQALARGAVLPFRIGTIFATTDGVRAMLAGRRAAFAAALRLLRGRAEWGVKVYAPHGRAKEPVGAPPASGTDYLVRRRAERTAAERSWQDVVDVLSAIHARLQDRADDSELLPTPDGLISPPGADMLFNAAYLVADANARTFNALAERLASEAQEHGLRLDLTGPWPAYHFTALEE
jgi:gas vesicle protein GvpL/GvpF